MRRFTNDYNPDGKEKRREARELPAHPSLVIKFKKDKYPSNWKEKCLCVYRRGMPP